jgi:hypothetical protein
MKMLLGVVSIVLASGCGGSQPDPESGSTTAPPATAEPSAEAGATPATTSTAAATGSPQSGELIGVPISDNKKPDSGSAAGDASSAGQSVEMVYVESKVPKGAGTKKLLFDVTLRNTRTEPRWYVLPSVVHPQDKMIKSGVDGVELYALKGDSRVTMGRFTGKGGFHAVLLPAGADLKVQKLPIECHYTTLKECAVPIEVVIAGKLAIGGEPAEKWFGDKASSEGKGQVTYEGSATRVGGKKASGSKEVALEDMKRVKMTLIIGGT